MSQAAVALPAPEINDLIGQHALHTQAILEDTDYENQPEDAQWHIRRRCGIGGSDVGAILGVNPYKTPHDIWLEKTGRKEPEDLSGKDAVLAGTLLEDAVAQFYSLRSGKQVRRSNQTRFHADMPWLAGNVDRIVQGERRILECKTAGHWAKGWGESGTDEVPESYLLQVTHYMAVWGYDQADLAVLTGGQKFSIYHFSFDHELFDRVAEHLQAFWFDHVIADVPPPPHSLAEIEAFYPSDDGSPVMANGEVAEAIERRAEFVSIKKETESAIKTEDEIIKGFMGDHATLVDAAGQKLASWKTQTDNRFDTARFKNEQPDLYQQYIKPSESRVFRI